MNAMLGKVDQRSGSRPRDGRHCDLCGCSQPAVRCDKCASQIFCLSCDDMYHRHPKRRFHMRKAVDPPVPQARPVLPAKAAHLGDPSKMPLPPPRKKKTSSTKSFFDTFRRKSPSRESSPPLPKKEYSWTDRLGNIKKFMSNRPLPPLPTSDGDVEINTLQDNSKNGMSFIHKKVNDKPPQLPQRLMKPTEFLRDKENQPNFIGTEMRNGISHARPENGTTNSWGKIIPDNHRSQHGVNRQIIGGPGFPGTLPNTMPQSASAMDLQNLNGGYPGPNVFPPQFPHYPMNPHMAQHYPYPPMYPPQFANYPQYFGNSFANLSSQPPTTDGDFSDNLSEVSSSKYHSSKRFRKKTKRSQSVLMDKMAYPGQFYPFGPYPPGYMPWGGPYPMEAPPSPAGSVRSLNRVGRSRAHRKVTSDEEDNEDYLSPSSSSPLSRPKSSSSSNRPFVASSHNHREVESSSESDEEEMDKSQSRGGKYFRKNSDLRNKSSPVSKSPQPHKKLSKQKRHDATKIEPSPGTSSEPKPERRNPIGFHTDEVATSAEPRHSPCIAGQKWHCDHCTFINEAGARICQVCCKSATQEGDEKDEFENTQEGVSNLESKISSPNIKKATKNKELKGKGEDRKGNQDMAVLNSALDEAEEEINRGLEELMKLKQDASPLATEKNSNSDHNESSPKLDESALQSNCSRPVYKSTGKIRSTILDKLTLPTGKRASETQTSPTTKTNNRFTEMRRQSTSSTTSDAYNSPIAQSPDMSFQAAVQTVKISDSACQTQTDDHLEHKRIAEDAYLGARSPMQYGDRYDMLASPVPAMYDRSYIGRYGLMQRAHSRASLFNSRMNDFESMEYGPRPGLLYRSVSRSSLVGDYPDSRMSEFNNLRRPDFYLSMEELVERRRQDTIRAQGLELVRMFREAEQQGFTADDIQVALHNCGKQNPLEWLHDNWRALVDNVISVSASYVNDKRENDVGMIRESEARDALRLHKGNVWAAVTECVESRQRKFLELKARGKFSAKDVTEALTESEGNVEAAFTKLAKSSSKPFLMRIWGAGEGKQNQDGAIPMPTEISPNVQFEKDSYDSRSDELWEDEDIEWEEDESEEVDEEHAEDLITCHDDIKTPESDKSDYCDAFGSNTLVKQVTLANECLPVAKVKKGSGFLSKLAALKKEEKSEDKTRDAPGELKDLEDTMESSLSLPKAQGPLSVIKNKILTLRDTIHGTKSDKKVTTNSLDRRTIVVKEVNNEYLNHDADNNVTLTSIKSLEDGDLLINNTVNDRKCQLNSADLLVKCSVKVEQKNENRGDDCYQNTHNSTQSETLTAADKNNKMANNQKIVFSADCTLKKTNRQKEENSSTIAQIDCSQDIVEFSENETQSNLSNHKTDKYITQTLVSNSITENHYDVPKNLQHNESNCCKKNSMNVIGLNKSEIEDANINRLKNTESQGQKFYEKQRSEKNQHTPEKSIISSDDVSSNQESIKVTTVTEEEFNSNLNSDSMTYLKPETATNVITDFSYNNNAVKIEDNTSENEIGCTFSKAIVVNIPTIEKEDINIDVSNFISEEITENNLIENHEKQLPEDTFENENQVFNEEIPQNFQNSRSTEDDKVNTQHYQPVDNNTLFNDIVNENATVNIDYQPEVVKPSDNFIKYAPVVSTIKDENTGINSLKESLRLNCVTSHSSNIIHIEEIKEIDKRNVNEINVDEANMHKIASKEIIDAVVTSKTNISNDESFENMAREVNNYIAMVDSSPHDSMLIKQDSHALTPLLNYKSVENNTNLTENITIDLNAMNCINSLVKNVIDVKIPKQKSPMHYIREKTQNIAESNFNIDIKSEIGFDQSVSNLSEKKQDSISEKIEEQTVIDNIIENTLISSNNIASQNTQAENIFLEDPSENIRSEIISVSFLSNETNVMSNEVIGDAIITEQVGLPSNSSSKNKLKTMKKGNKPINKSKLQTKNSEIATKIEEKDIENIEKIVPALVDSKQKHSKALENEMSSSLDIDKIDIEHTEQRTLVKPSLIPQLTPDLSIPTVETELQNILQVESEESLHNNITPNKLINHSVTSLQSSFTPDAKLNDNKKFEPTISSTSSTNSNVPIDHSFDNSTPLQISEKANLEESSSFDEFLASEHQNTSSTVQKVSNPSKLMTEGEQHESQDKIVDNSLDVSINNTTTDTKSVNEIGESFVSSHDDEVIDSGEDEAILAHIGGNRRRSSNLPSPVDTLRNRFEGLMTGGSPGVVAPARPQSPFRRMSFRSRKAVIALERTRESSTEKPWFIEKKNVEPKITPPPKRSLKQQLDIERRVRKLVNDRKCRTYRKAEVVVQLLDMNFEEEEAIQAANECSNFEKALSYLQQECLLCTGNFTVSHMICMVHCSHKACRQCLRAYFTVQIRDRNIMELLCPFCNEPDISDEDIAQDYFNHLDIMLKKLVDEDIHELFQRKLRDRVLMRDPNFKWCSQCSSGFIAMPNLKQLVCPDCSAVMCAGCRRLWEKEHQGMSCEAFAALKDATDPESQSAGLAKLLTENGIDCPRCHFRYQLAKGGCMHFRCTQCQHDFCSGCSKPFKMGQKCGVSEFCAKLGLHAHHPRNCLFYLRDKDPADLQRLLDMNEIHYNRNGSKTGTCEVVEQKESSDGMVDDCCGKDVEEGFAGLCRIHYVEYLGQLVNKHQVDPIQIFENDDLELVLRRANIRLPPKKYRETDAQYKDKLIDLIREELPLDRMDGS